MYLALYRKYRPKTFDDVVGQEAITRTLKNEVLHQQLAHAYLFTGSRGTGKTTCSKILAKAVNCLHPVDGNPCLCCENCLAIEDGTMLDVVEMDAASNNGVNDVRMLREEANYTPAQGKYRVYIIDETHMLSTAAFNALLKTMEEPPPHVIFILATTEVHKVPATILSRCQRFDFSRIKTADIAKRLSYIAGEEDFTLADDAAHLIARLADGGMRDAISILDQCTSYAKDVTLSVVSQATGLVLQDYLFDLADVIYRRQTADAIQKIDELYEGSKDLQKLLGDLIDHYRNLMIAKSVPDPSDLISCLPEDLVRLQTQAKELPLSSILYALSVLQEAMAQMAKGAAKRLTAEMAMIKLCDPALDDSNRALLSRIDRLEQQLRSGTFTVQAAASTAAPAVQPAVTPLAAPVEEAPQSAKPPAPKASETPVELPPNEAETPAKDISAKPKPAASQPAPDDAPKTPQMFDRWPEILGELQQRDPAMGGILAGSMAFTLGDALFIGCPNALFGQLQKRDNLIKQLRILLYEKTGIPYKVRVKKQKPAAKPDDQLTHLLDDAQALGIEVDRQ